MTELKGNEKYFHFSTNLPNDASNPGTIKTGDFMLWRADSFVLSIKKFPTPRLSSGVSSGNVKVTVELESGFGRERAVTKIG